MSKTKTIVQSLWIEKEISDLEQLSIISFLKNNHDYHLYTYGSVKNLPDGVTIKDANTILPKSEIFTYHNGRYSGFADWFRYELIRQTGEFWVDLDVICLKQFDFSDAFVFGLENPNLVCNAIMRFPAGHEVLATMAGLCANPNQIMSYDSLGYRIKKVFRRFIRGNKRSNVYYGEYGPDGLTLLLKSLGLFEKTKPQDFFYKIPPSQWEQTFFDTSSYNQELLPFKNSYAIHFWAEMLRKNGVEKDRRFEKNTLIELLREKYMS